MSEHDPLEQLREELADIDGEELEMIAFAAVPEFGGPSAHLDPVIESERDLENALLLLVAMTHAVAMSTGSDVRDVAEDIVDVHSQLEAQGAVAVGEIKPDE